MYFSIVDNWLGTYNNGFVRNGLLGHLHSILIGNQVNLVWLNLLGFGLIALNLIFIYRSFLKKSIVPILKYYFFLFNNTYLLSIYKYDRTLYSLLSHSFFTNSFVNKTSPKESTSDNNNYNFPIPYGIYS